MKQWTTKQGKKIIAGAAAATVALNLLLALYMTSKSILILRKTNKALDLYIREQERKEEHLRRISTEEDKRMLKKDPAAPALHRKG